MFFKFGLYLSIGIGIVSTTLEVVFIFIFDITSLKLLMMMKKMRKLKMHIKHCIMMLEFQLLPNREMNDVAEDAADEIVWCNDSK